MAVDNRTEAAGEPLQWGRVAAAAMPVVGGILALVAAVWALVALWARTSASAPAGQPGAGPNAAGVLEIFVWLMAAWSLSVLLWGAAEILRRLNEAADASLAGGWSAGRARSLEGGDSSAHLLEELVQLTRELRDIELLSEPERAKRLQAESEELVQQLERDIPALLREHNLQEAQLRAERARRRFPTLPNLDRLIQQIEQARQKLEAHDIETATREIDDLIALGAWDRAVEVVRHLRQRHPRTERIAELTKRIAAGREKATSEERARLMAQAQSATNQRDWTEALRVVETLLARYPGSPESRELRQQIPTLKSNVEIQVRQKMEADIRDLVKEQRFAEALRIANDLVSRYPDSPQAAVLRDQLPKLEQRAAEMAS